MRRTTVIIAGLAIAAGVLAATAPAAGADSSNEYICSMSVTPTSQSVAVGQNAYFSVRRDICSRSTGQFLYTDTRGTYWSSSNTAVARVGSAGHIATMNLTVTTHGAGTATITAIALCCDINYREVRVSASLTVNPPALQGWIAGSYAVQSGASCMWYANASGGTGTYTYQWFHDGSPAGTGAFYTAYDVYYGFTLQVQISDSAGHTVSDSRYIDTYGSYGSGAGSGPGFPLC